ncbi:membrane bound O-acyl transferase family-domain-containing protein [Aspergillus floccosus]
MSDPIQDPASLLALIHASPICYQQFRLDRIFILWSCLELTLGKVVVDAHVVHLPSARDFLSTRTQLNMAQFIASYRDRRSASPSSILHELDVEDLTRMHEFPFSDVIPSASQYTRRAMDHLAAQTGIPQSAYPQPPSQAEETRLMRALYRFQLCCNVFSLGHWGHFFMGWPEYMNEYILQHLMTYHQVFDEICDDFGEDNARYDDSRFTPDAVDLREHSVQRTYILKGTISRGLKLLHIVSQIRDHDVLRGQPQPACNVLVQQRAPMRFRGDQEADNAPSLGWVLWRETYSNTFGGCTAQTLRRWGYVIRSVRVHMHRIIPSENDVSLRPHPSSNLSRSIRTRLYTPIYHPLLKHIIYIAIPSSALHATVSPPQASPFIKYANAFLSVAYVIRAVELLLVYDLRQLKHAHKACPSTYVWHPIPRTLSLNRLRCTTDLLINPRGIGWSYATAYSPPSADSYEPPARFVKRSLLKLLATYALFEAHQATFGRNFPSVAVAVHATAHRIGIQLTPAATATIARDYLLGPACWLAAYAFIDGCHALVAVAHVILRAGAQAEPWMYPPLFRSPRAMLTCRLRDIWGKMWHDLCRRPLLAISLLLIPGNVTGTLKRLLVLFVSFAVSGCVHAAGAYAVSGDAYRGGVMVVFFVIMAGCIALQEVVALGVDKVLGGVTNKGYAIL